MELFGRNLLLFLLSLVLLFNGFSTVSSASPPAKIVSGLISSSLSSLMKWAWSLKSTTKTGQGCASFDSVPCLNYELKAITHLTRDSRVTGRSMMKFESGYKVETVFDGSKLGIEPYSVEVLPDGELLILDSANSNLYRISSSLSLYSRPKLVAGSPEGYAGHVDGKHREAKMNHPTGVAVDDRGNIYVADTMNMAIRKISDSGVTTIAGGKWSRSGGHVDGPSDEAKFSNDFDVVYVGSSCSLLVIDRGNGAIREIQLRFDDCAYQYGSSFPLGIAVLLAAGFFGYMLALLQRRVGSIVSSQNEITTPQSSSSSLLQKPRRSVRPPLIPTEDHEAEKQEGFLGSLGKLLANAGTVSMEIIAGIIPGLKRKSVVYRYQNQVQFQQSQESFEIPKEEEPPSLESRGSTPKKLYPFMSKEAKKVQHQLRQSRSFYSGGWNGDLEQQKQQHRHQHHSSKPQTYYEKSCEKTNEIVFGAVQEEGRRDSVIRPTDYAMAAQLNQQNYRARSHVYSNGDGYPYYT